MPWVNDHIQVHHERAPWDPHTPSEVLVHCNLSFLYGTHPSLAAVRAEREELYERAKNSLDVDAGWAIVREAIRDEAYDQLVGRVVDYEPLIIVIPHPAFEEGSTERQDASLGPTNAIPFVFGHYLAERLGCEVDNEITQIARVGRTGLSRFNVFCGNPAFRVTFGVGRITLSSMTL